MSKQVQIKEDKYFYHVGYFDPRLKYQPADIAFRVVSSIRKSDVTPKGIAAIAQEIAREINIKETPQ